MKKFLITFIILFSIIFGLWKLSNSRTYQITGELISRVELTDSLVALTFDDGPTKEYTDDILDVLNSHEVPATFFLTGREIQQNRAEAERIVRAGHQVGNHSYSHPQMVLKSPSFISDELTQTDAVIREIGYDGEIYFRPPYSKKLFLLPWELSKRGQTSVTWDIEPESYPEVRQSAETIADHVEEKVSPGSIILLHVMYGPREESRQAVPLIIERLRNKGYRFVTVSELINAGEQAKPRFSMPVW